MQRKLFLWLCLMATANAHAVIYQWTDSTGTVQFSDQRPPERVDVIERQDIESRAEARPATPAQQPPAAIPTTSEHKARPRSVVRADSPREIRKRRCDGYRQRIAAIQAQLRAGYSARRGIVLSERLRAVDDAYYHECR
jgi:hypothetical protein